MHLDTNSSPGTANISGKLYRWQQSAAARPVAMELSTLQRSASHMASRVDILTKHIMVGGAAVKAADEGDSGKMVVLQRLSDDPYQSGTEVKDVHKIANDEKLVPRNWVNKEGTYVTRGIPQLRASADTGRCLSDRCRRNPTPSVPANIKAV